MRNAFVCHESYRLPRESHEVVLQRLFFTAFCLTLCISIYVEGNKGKFSSSLVMTEYVAGGTIMRAKRFRKKSFVDDAVWIFQSWRACNSVTHEWCHIKVWRGSLDCREGVSRSWCFFKQTFGVCFLAATWARKFPVRGQGALEPPNKTGRQRKNITLVTHTQSQRDQRAEHTHTHTPCSIQCF